MKTFALTPEFTDRAGYMEWRKEWAAMQKRLMRDIRIEKNRVKATQRSHPELMKEQTRKYQLASMMGRKAMGILRDAKDRMMRIQKMKKERSEHLASLPLSFDNCQTCDFHFNKGNLIFPNILPPWTLVIKGTTYHVEHVEASLSWNTRETPEKSTKGALRFRNCKITISEENIAYISS
jgi:hypothetical protein